MVRTTKLRSAVSWLLWILNISSFARRILASNGRFVLVFHGVSKRKNPNIPSDIQPYLTADDLRTVLGWLKKRFSFLAPNDLLESSKNGVLLTFDDGLANNHTNVLPLLEEFSVPAIFFVSTQQVESPRNWLPAMRAVVRRYWTREDAVPSMIAADFYDGMSREQLAQSAWSPLVTIGSHTVSHPFLTQCSSEQLIFELVESKRFLQEVTRQTIDLFAYPAGNYDRRVVEAVQDVGYRMAFAEDRHNLGFPDFEIPRIGVYEASPAYLGLKLSGFHRRPIKGLPGSF